jgi:hypothetical protein
LARREKYNTRTRKLNILKNAVKLRSKINCERGKGKKFKPLAVWGQITHTGYFMEKYFVFTALD